MLVFLLKQKKARAKSPPPPPPRGHLDGARALSQPPLSLSRPIPTLTLAPPSRRWSSAPTLAAPAREAGKATQNSVHSSAPRDWMWGNGRALPRMSTARGGHGQRRADGPRVLSGAALGTPIAARRRWRGRLAWAQRWPRLPLTRRAALLAPKASSLGHTTAAAPSSQVRVSGGSAKWEPNSNAACGSSARRHQACDGMRVRPASAWPSLRGRGVTDASWTCRLQGWASWRWRRRSALCPPRRRATPGQRERHGRVGLSDRHATPRSLPLSLVRSRSLFGPLLS